MREFKFIINKPSIVILKDFEITYKFGINWKNNKKIITIFIE